MRIPALLLATLLAAGTLSAKDVVIYRCTNASGALTIQNDVPCPKGAKQERRIVQPAQTVATPVTVSQPRPALVPVVRKAESKAPDVAEAEPVSTIAPADRLPPPPLFQCNTFDNDSYLSDDDAPAPRCIRLQTTGIGGSDTGAGEACQMVTDQCQRVPDAAACEAWAKRLKEVEAAWRFARAADKEANQVEYRRVSTILRDSTCGT